MDLQTSFGINWTLDSSLSVLICRGSLAATRSILSRDFVREYLTSFFNQMHSKELFVMSCNCRPNCLIKCNGDAPLPQPFVDEKTFVTPGFFLLDLWFDLDVVFEVSERADLCCCLCNCAGVHTNLRGLDRRRGGTGQQDRGPKKPRKIYVVFVLDRLCYIDDFCFVIYGCCFISGYFVLWLHRSLCGLTSEWSFSCDTQTSCALVWTWF